METRGVTLHRASEDDWRRVKELRLAALLDAPLAFASTHEREAAQADEWWRARLRSAGVSTLLASCGGEAAGMATVAAGTEPAEAWLYGVWVAPGMRGRGVGDELMAGAAREARRAGASRLLLEVGDWNTAAQGLYGRHGFAATGRRSTLPPPREHMVELEFALGLR